MTANPVLCPGTQRGSLNIDAFIPPAGGKALEGNSLLRSQQIRAPCGTLVPPAQGTGKFRLWKLHSIHAMVPWGWIPTKTTPGEPKLIPRFPIDSSLTSAEIFITWAGLTLLCTEALKFGVQHRAVRKGRSVPGVSQNPAELRSLRWQIPSTKPSQLPALAVLLGRLGRQGWE